MVERMDNVAETAKDVLENLLDLMGVNASIHSTESMPIETGEEEAAVVNLDVEGEDLGILIGRRGLTLSCIQYIVRIIVGHKTETWLPIVVDIEGYKRRRQEALEILAHQVEEEVKADNMPFTLEPMLPYERRIVHLALADSEEVVTESSGEGEARRVVVIPKA